MARSQNTVIPRIIAAPRIIAPPPTLLAIFSFFYPLPVNCDRKMTYSFLFFISYISSALGLTFTRKTALKFLNLKINGPWKRRDVRGLASGVRVACCARVMNSWHPPSAGICLGARFFWPYSGAVCFSAGDTYKLTCHCHPFTSVDFRVSYRRVGWSRSYLCYLHKGLMNTQRLQRGTATKEIWVFVFVLSHPQAG